MNSPPLLSSWEIEAMLRGEKLLSFDLGVTYDEYEVIQKGSVLCVEGVFCLPVPVLKRAARRRGRVYSLEGEGERYQLRHVAIRDRHYYQLVQPQRGKPTTLEIDGIHMHRIKGSDPYRDAMEKVEALGVRRNHAVWDTCGGLGYTTIFSLRKGAQVLTTEKDPNVLKLARINPWSREMWRADVRNADAFHFVKKLPDNSFDRILHDPPRFALAGELYSLEFYRQLYRVLKPGGVLYHYTGSPGRKRGKDIQRGVMRRLFEAGFRYLKRERKTEGVIAVKPAR
ncbi:MAG: methyltransferase domain-containing protein [Candidatus Diapherotrites archaeon]|nr:methyltransferase domain-containing protein [Candidatus Diapherotrites archaeon]